MASDRPEQRALRGGWIAAVAGLVLLIPCTAAAGADGGAVIDIDVVAVESPAPHETRTPRDARPPTDLPVGWACTTTRCRPRSLGPLTSAAAFGVWVIAAGLVSQRRSRRAD